MGEVLAAAALERRGQPAEVTSAGTMAALGAPATEDAVATVARMGGPDLSGHLSRPVDEAMVAHADLILAMEHHHVLTLVTEYGAPFGATFTLPDLAARASAVEPRHDDENFAGWLERMGEGRTTAAVLGGGPDTEVADPIGRPARHYRAAARQIADALDAVFDALL